jgi:hypothetical protein
MSNLNLTNLENKGKKTFEIFVILNKKKVNDFTIKIINLIFYIANYSLFIISVKRRISAEHEIKNHADRPNVTFLIIFSVEYFRSNIMNLFCIIFSFFKKKEFFNRIFFFWRKLDFYSFVLIIYLLRKFKKY